MGSDKRISELTAEVRRLELDFNCRLEQIRNHCESELFQKGTIIDMTRQLRAPVSDGIFDL